MTFFSSNLKMGKCLEWYAQLPSTTQDLYNSPVFYIQNAECYFKMFKSWQGYHLTLFSETVKKPFSIIVYANYEGKLFRKESSSVHLRYGGYCGGELCVLESSTDSQKSASSFGHFTFIFEPGAEVELSLPAETKTENKSIQPGFVSKDKSIQPGFVSKDKSIQTESLSDDRSIQTESLSDDRSIQTGSYLNGNIYMESLTDDFSKLLETGLNHDAEIKCGEHSLKIHSAVLCARSEAFKTMLQSQFLGNQPDVVEIQDLDASYFRDFVHYLYTGLMPELTFDKAKTLYEVGDKYDVKSLMFRCSEYLQDILSEENAFECFSLGDAHSDQKLKDKIKDFILDKKIYLVEEYWAPFCEKFPMFAMDLYRLVIQK